MKKIIGIVSVCVCVFALGTTTLYFKGNKNAQVSEKYIGSDDSFLIKEELETLEPLLERTELIVKGQAINIGETVKKTNLKNSELNEKYQSQFGKPLASTFTYLDFQIEEVIDGDISLNNSIIKIRQRGEAGIDKGETKLKKGKNQLLLLEEAEEGVYRIVGLENGAFTIENDIVDTHGNDKCVSEFDKKSVKKLVNKLKKIKKKG